MAESAQFSSFWRATARGAQRFGRIARRRLPARLTDPFSFSSLTARIAALNITALALLVGSVLYLSQFRAGLIDLKITSLKTEADLIAVTIAEAAGEPGSQRYDRILANEVLRRLALPTGLRAQLYDRSGRLTGDTRSLLGGQVVVEIDDLPAARSGEGLFGEFSASMEALYRRASELLFGRLELYRETPSAGISRDAEVYAALAGRRDSAERVNSERELILSVAVPVQRVKSVLGALVLSTEGGDIDQIVREERSGVLQLFGVAFVVVTLVAFALAQTIAWPIRKLAEAAERVGARQGATANLTRIRIPNFTDRTDEIGELSGALMGMTDALYQRIEAIESFAADVAHEIKNPLTSLRSAVESLRAARTDDQRMELLGVIEHDVRRMDRLVTDISNASRLDAELVRQKRRSFDLAKLLCAVCSVASSTGERRGVTVAFDAPDGPASLSGLEDRLAQVFHNVLDNAISFCPEGAGIKVRLSDARIEGKPARLVEIEDEGPGIPAENLESIFARFYSSRPDGEAFGRHSGLGLSICRQIVSAHGGRIWAENRKDRSGARFSVLLPR